MRAVPADLLKTLRSGVMANADVFIVTLLDGTRLGFSSVDVPVTVDGVECAPESGFTATTYDATLGAATDGTDIEGLLDSDRITEEDIHRGRWEGASVAQYLVDWQSGEAVLLHVQTIAETERDGNRFVAQLRSASAKLEDERGRILGSTCPYILGDAECGVDLAPFTVSGGVDAAGSDWIESEVFEAQEDGWYDDGAVTLSGGMAAQVARHEGARVTFWRALPVDIEPGTAFTAVAGCDKTWGTCRRRFGNGDAFGGFPHMPGRDAMFQAGGDEAAPSNVPVVLSDPPLAPIIETAVGDGDGSATVTFARTYAMVESRGDGTAASVHGSTRKIRIEGLPNAARVEPPDEAVPVTVTLILVAVVGEIESDPSTVTVAMPEAWPEFEQSDQGQ